MQKNQSDIINRPPHYTEGRNLQPIEVIEAWGLCHHLACVVKYISRAGRKHDAIRDLEKAVWYVEREIYLSQQPKGPCTKRPFVKSPEVENVAQDWGLSENLELALSYMKNELLHPTMERALNACKSALKDEISRLTIQQKETEEKRR